MPGGGVHEEKMRGEKNEKKENGNIKEPVAQRGIGERIGLKKVNNPKES